MKVEKAVYARNLCILGKQFTESRVKAIFFIKHQCCGEEKNGFKNYEHRVDILKKNCLYYYALGKYTGAKCYINKCHERLSNRTKFNCIMIKDYKKNCV